MLKTSRECDIFKSQKQSGEIQHKASRPRTNLNTTYMAKVFYLLEGENALANHLDVLEQHRELPSQLREMHIHPSTSRPFSIPKVLARGFSESLNASSSKKSLWRVPTDFFMGLISASNYRSQVSAA